MNNNQMIESSSYSIPEYGVPGHLFLVNDWEGRTPTPNNGVLTLVIPRNEYGVKSNE